jgi:hypothetical protein
MKIIINNFKNICNLFNENIYITFINYHYVILPHLKNYQLQITEFFRTLSMLIEMSFCKEC